MISLIGTAGGQLVNVAAIPILSRLYEPEHFGIWALYLAATAIIPTLISLRFDIAIVTARTERVAREVTILTICLSVIGGIALGGIALGVWLCGQLWTIEQPKWIYLVPLGVASTTLYAVGLNWWLRTGDYRRITIARIALPLGAAVMQVAFIGLAEGIGLVVGSVVAQTFVVLAMLAAIGPQLSPIPPLARLPIRWLALIKRFRSLALYTMPYSLQGQVFRQALVITFASFASIETAGLFSMAQRCVYSPLTLIVSALEQAVFPRLARTPRDPEIHRLVVRTMLALAVPLGAGCAILTAFAEPLVTLALGQKWSASAPYVAATSYATASLVVSAWIVRVFDIFDRQRLHLIVDLAANILILLVCAGSLYVWRDPLLSVFATSGVMAVYYAIWAMLAFHISGIGLRSLFGVFTAGAMSWGLAYGLTRLCSRVLGIEFPA